MAADSTVSAQPGTLHHRLRRMTGRDPDQAHRTSTPLELLFDLTFVVSLGLAADQTSHLVAEGHFAPALLGFGFSIFVIGWAWINFSWFASAFDTDDWFFRVATMVQMVGVLVVALGLPTMFASLDHGTTFDNGIIVVGYVIMRVALVAQWLRAAVQDPQHRRVALTYALVILVAQVGWVSILFIRSAPVPVLVAIIAVTLAIDLGGPVFAERKDGGTPWHAHHIAERYGLFVIIALGEGVFGTVASVSAVVQQQGWSAEAVLVVVAGTGLTFGLWWVYFTMPSGIMLHARRRKAFPWGYAHLFVFASITATGAGLHVAAYVIEGESELGPVGAVLSVAAPVLLFVLALFVIYSYLMSAVDGFHAVLLIGTVALLVLAVLLASWGVSIGVSLLFVMAAPFVVVVGYETLGYRHQQAVLDRTLAQADGSAA
jgi:low temperature requirement protein LtrA